MEEARQGKRRQAGLKPFRLDVPEAALADLRERLKRTRFPDQAPGEPWKTGTSLAYLKDLLQYWQSGFDWRAQEARINAFAQSYATGEPREAMLAYLEKRKPRFA